MKLQSALVLAMSALTSITAYAVAPLGLLTPDYGIVTNDDLAYDAAPDGYTPYDPKGGLSSPHWQCAPATAVSAKLISWRGTDPGKNSNKLFNMCSVEIRLRNGGDLHVYADHRGHRMQHCNMLMREWSKVTAGEKIVCVNGDHTRTQTDDEDGSYQLWTWQKFKTRKGCFSYFSGQCDTKGCAEGKCQN